MVRRTLLLLGLLAATIPARAEAAGFHFFKVEAIGTASADEYAAGFGFSMWSDLARLWLTFGDPGGEGGVVRQGWLESRRYGPVVGVVPPAFQDIVEPYPNPWLVPWGSVRLGGDGSAGKDFEADVAQHLVLTVPGMFGVDARRAYAGPTAGVGLNGTWWHDWRDLGGPAMTGKLTGQGGLAAGFTLRDTFYGQARATGRVDLFGAHQAELVVLGVTGLYLERVGVPLGVEVSGELASGDDNTHARPEATWQARASLFWKLTPPYQTRVEESVQREIRQAAR